MSLYGEHLNISRHEIHCDLWDITVRYSKSTYWKASWCLFLNQYYSDDQIKEDEIVGVFRKHERK